MEPNQRYAERPGNPTLDKILFFADQEATYKVNNPLARKDDPVALDHLKKQYENILSGLRETRRLTPEEKRTRAYLRHEVRRLRATLQPTFVRTVIHFRPINWLLNALLGRQANYRQHQRVIHGSSQKTLVEYNTAQLHQQMAEVGFTGQIETALKQMMVDNPPSFSIRHMQPNVPHTDFLLHFTRLPGREVYYFQSFDATSRPNIQSVLCKDPASPTIHFTVVGAAMVFSAAEAGNLANGRPVQKQWNGQDVWYMQDHSGAPSLQQRPFNLDQALADWKVKVPGDSTQRAKLIATLRSGGVGTIAFKQKDGQVEHFRVKVGFNADRLMVTDVHGRYVDPKTIGNAREKAVGLSQELQNTEKQRTKITLRSV
jgi:hypothetical protein